MLDMSFIIFSFAIIGAGIKYIDDTLDENSIDKKAIFIAAILLIIWSAVSLADPYASTILFSILIGVILSGKADNFIFIFGSVLLLILHITITEVNVTVALFLGALAAIDEAGNDFSEKQIQSKAKELLLRHRFALKTGVLLMYFIGVFPLLYVIAMVFFDVFYDITGWLMNRWIKKRKLKITHRKRRYPGAWEPQQ